MATSATTAAILLAILVGSATAAPKTHVGGESDVYKCAQWIESRTIPAFDRAPPFESADDLYVWLELNLPDVIKNRLMTAGSNVANALRVKGTSIASNPKEVAGILFVQTAKALKGIGACQGDTGGFLAVEALREAMFLRLVQDQQVEALFHASGFTDAYDIKLALIYKVVLDYAAVGATSEDLRRIVAATE